MKTFELTLYVALLLGVASANLQAQSTAFTYQGRLSHGGSAANGAYEMSFALYDARTNGQPVATPVTVAPVQVSNGMFTAVLDFGANAFVGPDRWLEISVTVFGSDQPVTPLIPRQPITPTPYALHASNAANLMSFVDIPMDIKINGQRILRLEATGNSPNIIGGVEQNVVAPGVIAATIGGGGFSAGPNEIEASYSTIGGGGANKVHAGANAATIAGGFENRVGSGANDATIAGGNGNQIDMNAGAATIAGGIQHIVRPGAHFATIGGGFVNIISNNSLNATVSGGGQNRISSDAANATLAGGYGNSIGVGASDSIIGGGRSNVISIAAHDATIAGGAANVAGREYSTIAGGEINSAGGQSATIGGGHQNTNSGTAGVIAGGGLNTGAGDYAAIGGGFGNLIQGSTFGSTIAGGGRNTIQTYSGWATIAGGVGHIIQTNAPAATIGGGSGHVIQTDSDLSTISGGESNTVQTYAGWAMVGGGRNNTIQTDADLATIGGGDHNTIRAESDYATIAGGKDNESSGVYATVPGGCRNIATNNAFAAGTRARANHTGAFVWADAAGEYDARFSFESTATNEFAVRATGGVRFVTAIDTNGSSVAGVTIAAGSGTWSSLSDRSAKENLESANPREILNKVATLPLASWNYKAQGADVRHLGPMSQDFRTAFGLGSDDRHIDAIDADGVALAAIQGLNQKLDDGNQQLEVRCRKLDERLQQREVEIAELKQRLEMLERIIKQHE